MAKTLFYITGDDEEGKYSELSKLETELLNGQDKSLCVESFDLSNAGEDEEKSKIIESAVSSLISPPFLTPFRIVIISNIGAASTEDVASLLSYIENPVETSYLIVIQGGGRISASLTKAWKNIVEQRGQVKESENDVLKNLIKEHKIKLEPGLNDLILKHYGQDSTKIRGLFSRLESVYGTNSQVGFEEVKPFMGEAGNVAIYELSNDILNGDIKTSLDVVSRMMHSTSSANVKPMHPLQILSLLSNHFRKLATLDDSSIRNQNDAYSALGSKGNPYAAKKTLDASRSLGTRKILTSIEILGCVDTILKGANAIDAEIAIELCITSLCQICVTSDQQEIKKIRDQFNESLYV
ncbi:MAG: hypothetical protein U0R17_05690 [Acidimicrobiia bacterium]